MKLHLDTGLGGDPDDACALAMLLGWPDVEIVGVTTTADAHGWRASYVAYLLRLADRGGIPVVAGAGTSLTTSAVADPVIADERHWPSHLQPQPSPPGAALDLLAHSINQGATIVTIGPRTNLALLEVLRPGSLGRSPVVVMGGWLDPPAAGLPAWGPAMDFNVQWDTRTAEIVAASAEVIYATLSATLKAHLRAIDLPRLRGSGPLGELLANQSVAHAKDAGMVALGRAHAGLPDDLVNFHYDPVACAVAAGWSGAAVETMRLRPRVDAGVLRLERVPTGQPAHVVVDVDGARFAERWLTAIEAAQGGK